jgi:hypothetical protein
LFVAEIAGTAGETMKDTLYKAVLKPDLGKVKELCLSHGGLVNMGVEHYYHRTALAVCCFELQIRRAAMAALLIDELGADVNLRDREGCSPVFLAATAGSNRKGTLPFLHCN